MTRLFEWCSETNNSLDAHVLKTLKTRMWYLPVSGAAYRFLMNEAADEGP